MERWLVDKHWYGVLADKHSLGIVTAKEFQLSQRRCSYLVSQRLSSCRRRNTSCPKAPDHFLGLQGFQAQVIHHVLLFKLGARGLAYGLPQSVVEHGHQSYITRPVFT